MKKMCKIEVNVEQDDVTVNNVGVTDVVVTDVVQSGGGGGDNLELGGNRTTTNPSLVNDECVSFGIEFDDNSQDTYFGPTIWIPD